MATTFYLSSSSVALISPGFAAWTRTTDGDRYMMSPTKDTSPMTSKTFWGNTSPAASDTCLARQYISAPMAAGIAFAVTDTVSVQVRCRESSSNDNINRTPICIKVYSKDGLTLRATLLALAHYGPNTTEWISGTLTNKEAAAAVSLTGAYTTVAGDRLVLEIGGMVSVAGGSGVTGTQSFGSDNGTDLRVNETDTAAYNPWFLMSRTISFDPIPSGTIWIAASGQRTLVSGGGLEALMLDPATGRRGVTSGYLRYITRNSDGTLRAL